MATLTSVFCVLTIQALVFINAEESGSQCKVGWLYNNGSCYAFPRDLGTWPEGQAYCSSLGGILAEVKSEGENNFIYSKARELQLTHTWLGATDTLDEGNWRWTSTNEPLDTGYTKWYAGDPNNGGTEAFREHCLALWASPDEWLDADCTTKKNFVCKYSPADFVDSCCSAYCFL